MDLQVLQYLGGGGIEDRNNIVWYVEVIISFSLTHIKKNFIPWDILRYKCIIKRHVRHVYFAKISTKIWLAKEEPNVGYFKQT